MVTHQTVQGHNQQKIILANNKFLSLEILFWRKGIPVGENKASYSLCLEF